MVKILLLYVNSALTELFFSFIIVLSSEGPSKLGRREISAPFHFVWIPDQVPGAHAPKGLVPFEMC